MAANLFNGHDVYITIGKVWLNMYQQTNWNSVPSFKYWIIQSFTYNLSLNNEKEN